MDETETETRITSPLELVSVFPPVMRVLWGDNGSFALRECDAEEATALLAPDPLRCRTFLDCGVWSGDGTEAPLLRTFAVLCGRSVVLCEFRPGAPLNDVEGPRHEVEPLNRVLRAIAGPQRIDVQILRWLRIPADDLDPATTDANTVFVFLPDQHLPVVPKMPDLDPSLIPDPTQVQCFCHGPVMQRILRGEVGDSPYRAFGASLSRDPNEWFYLMVERFRPVAEDLNKFVSRLHRIASSHNVHLVQLGSLFEVWAGYKVIFHSTGRAGLVSPQIVRGAHFGEFNSRWEPGANRTATLEALRRFSQFPAARRTLLASDYEWLASQGDAQASIPEQRSTHRAGIFYAEHHPEDRPTALDRPPGAMMAVLEQQSRFIPWTRSLREGWRDPMMVYGAMSLALDRNRESTPMYVMGYSHVPCLVHVIL